MIPMSSAPALGSVTEAFASALTMVAPVVQWVFIIAGAGLCLVGAFHWATAAMSGTPTRGGRNILLGTATVTGGLLLPSVTGLIASALGGEDQPTAPSDPTPVDLSWLGAVGTVIAVIGGIAAVAGAGVLVFRRVRRRRAHAANAREARARLAVKWAQFRDLHDDLLRKYLHAETDWDSLFFTPALSDPTVPTTEAMLRAMRNASTLRDTVGELPADLPADADLTTLPYPRAVDDFALAWDAAEKHARRVGQSGVPAAERKVIRQVRTLLDVAENSAASETERTLAYRRAQNLIGELRSIHVPDRAMAQLEERHRLMVTVASS